VCYVQILVFNRTHTTVTRGLSKLITVRFRAPLRATKRSDTRKQASTCTRTDSQQMGSWETALRVSPDTQGCIHYDKINAFGTRYGHTVAVVKHQGEWWWDSDPPQVAKHRGGSASEIQPAEPEMTNSSYTDKAERRTIHASSISKKRNASG
jgi:hypothetical protein